jgi:hypothetical protein
MTEPLAAWHLAVDGLDLGKGIARTMPRCRFTSGAETYLHIVTLG